jgi:hypothetical protein
MREVCRGVRALRQRERDREEWSKRLQRIGTLPVHPVVADEVIARNQPLHRQLLELGHAGGFSRDAGGGTQRVPDNE